jgi:hypothetical protein
MACTPEQISACKVYGNLDRTFRKSIFLLYPTACSRLTEDLYRRRGLLDDKGNPAESASRLDASNVAPFIVWLGSSESANVTGRVFGVRGDTIVVAEGSSAGPTCGGLLRRWVLQSRSLWPRHCRTHPQAGSLQRFGDLTSLEAMGIRINALFGWSGHYLTKAASAALLHSA